MLQKIVEVIILVGFLAEGAFSQQCYSGPNCSGSIIVDTPGSTVCDCCAGTDEGMSYGSPGDCTQCIVHGFEKLHYSTLESMTLLDINFTPNVTGEGHPSNIELIIGTIRAMDDTASITDDIATFPERAVDERSGYSAIGMNVIPDQDDLSLEDNDRIKLVFIPRNPFFTPAVFFQATGECLRDVAFVNIIDDDRLTINFRSLDYDVVEHDLMITVYMTIRETQRNFTLILRPTDIDTALLESAGTSFDLNSFVGPAYTEAQSLEKATPGDDYDDTVFTIEIPSNPVTHDISQVFRIVNDTINEVEQRYVIIGELGEDVPDEFVCFWVTFGEDVCRGRKGATGIGINDDDPMFIGFETRSTIVPETNEQGDDLYQIHITIVSLRASEITFRFGIRVTGHLPQTASREIAIVEQFVGETVFEHDATFGERERLEDPNSDLVEIRQLSAGSTRLSNLVVTILSDTLPEATECFSMSIFRSEADRMVGNFQSNKNDDPTATLYFEEHIVCIEDDDEPFRVGFDETMYDVVESEGTVEVCVNLTFPRGSIQQQEITVSVFDDPTSRYLPPNPVFADPDPPDLRGNHHMEPMTDYEQETLFYSQIRGTSITNDRRMICYDQVIYDDSCLELTEYVGLGLNEVGNLVDVDIEESYGDSAITIYDDDRAVVGLEEISYIVSEDVGVVQVCVVVFPNVNCSDCLIKFAFEVYLSTLIGSAVPPDDYGEFNVTLMFAACETRRCVNVTIVDDLIDEPEENFFYTLERTPGLHPNIDLDPTLGEIMIEDDDVHIQVGYNPVVYTTSEGEGMVELNIFVFSHPGTGTPRPFTLSVSTIDGTAESPGDYGGVSGQMIQFNTGDVSRTHTISIINDSLCETDPNEFFFSNITLFSGVPPIEVTEPLATVIINDTLEPECDPIEVGYDPIVYRTSEGQGSVMLTIRIFKPMSGGAPRPFTLSVSTQDDTAMSPGDYVSVSGEMIQFNRGDISKTHTITIRDDSVCEEDDEQFFSNIVLVSGIPEIVVTEPRATVIIEPSDCVDTTVIVNDTLTGDPLMTVPIWTDPNIKPGDPVTSLCYEVHGEDDKYFNLISDTCVSVNAHYSKAVTGSDNIRLNIVDEIGVRAISSTGDSVDISVGLEDCEAYVNGVNMTKYKENGIYVRAYNKNRVRIAVPNGARVDKDLVMWVFCTSGKTEDPVTWQFFNINFIRFVVMRGLNLDPTSHGIIGQFWNIPVEVSIHAGLFNSATLPNDYDITVMYPGKPERQFVGIKSSVTWEFEERDCLYVGNSQAGPLGEIVDPNDSVIEGTYDSYEVDSLFSPDYGFSRFDEENCPF